MFGKPLSQLTATDIAKLCKEQARESDIVEFKEGLSAKGGFDAWHTGADKFGDTARDKIIHEIIAFANAHGGTLVLGLEESSDKPARAQAVKPIGRCADLAERLSRALAALVEPPLAPFPVIVPVLVDGDTGVVVFQIAASLNAPHRHRSTLQSYVRRGEQAVPMTMREIQDHTMQVERGLALLEGQFAASGDRFDCTQRASIALGLRATAVPLTQLSLPIPSDDKVKPYLNRFPATRGQRKFEIFIPGDPVNYRPILRGIRAVDTQENGYISVEIKASGFLEVFFFRQHGEALTFPADWFVGIACNALFMADTLRQAAGSPGTEYGLELEVFARSKFSVVANGGREFGFDDTWNAADVVFPKYSVGERSHFGDIMTLVDADFWNAIGKRRSAPLCVKFPA